MVISLYDIFKPKELYNETTGVITRIIEEYDVSTDAMSYTPIISYSYNGKTYDNVEYGAYNSSMKIGDEVKVYVSLKDPTLIQSDGYEKAPYVILVFSTIILFFSLYKL